jgi:benzoate-CoA ligase family protein
MAAFPEEFNLADYLLDARIREGRGDKVALLTDHGRWTYSEMRTLANRFGNVLREEGVEAEQRVLIALPDGPEFAAVLFGTLTIGAVVVMVNPDLKPDAIEYLLEYTRAKVAVTHGDFARTFHDAALEARHLRTVLVVGDPAFDDRVRIASPKLQSFPTHRDDAAIWLFSGGTTGRPKAVVQTHGSFANTTECYAKKLLGYCADDVTLSVPKLFFGYATGSNLFFPFAAGGTAVLFPERCTADVLFEKIAKFRPTILVNVPTMVHQMTNHPRAREQDLSCLRFATSAGEALPEELYERWHAAFGVDLLDGLGTAEMWHIFLTNAPGSAKPGSLGRPVPGFEVRVRDDEGRDVEDGEVGWLWVRGDSRAIGYWHEMEKTKSAFRGEWYVSGDMVRCDEEGYFWYCGRGDDMLKVSGKWLSPQEVENCLLQHPDVAEVAVVGVVDANGLTKPHAFVVPKNREPSGLAEALRAFALERLEPYKAPRQVILMDSLPRTHLGKVDRGKLRVADVTATSSTQR